MTIGIVFYRQNCIRDDWKRNVFHANARNTFRIIMRELFGIENLKTKPSRGPVVIENNKNTPG